jgi:hypothetical protein
MAAQDNLKCFAIAGRTASGAATAVDDVDQEELRLPLTALLSTGYTQNLQTGAANPNAFRVRQNTGTDMNVLVGSGTTKIDGYVLLGGVAGQGAYMIRLDATTKTVAVPATDVTNPARYGVYAFIDDTAYSGDPSRAYANVTCIRGTPAGSPVTPTALAAWSASALLWEFQLPANATAVTNTILDAGTDRRVRSGGQLDARGVIAYAQATLNQTGVTDADLTSLTVTFTADANRRYKTTVFCGNVTGGASGNTAVLQIRDGGGTVKQFAQHYTDTVSTLDINSMTAIAVETGLSGSTTRKAHGLGTTAVAFNASATQPNFIMVEDAGPA